MRFAHLCLLIVLGLCSALVLAQEPYGQHDPQRVLVQTTLESGEVQYQLDYAKFDPILVDLARHARYYPVRFDSDADAQRATQDTARLIALLDPLMEGPQLANAPFMSRAAMLYSIGHNLDIPQAAQKAHFAYETLIRISPNDPQVNYAYGTFLTGSGNADMALPFLQKARDLGVVEANYSLGISYLMLGQKETALDYLQAYLRANPDATETADFIEAINEGRVEMQTAPAP